MSAPLRTLLLSAVLVVALAGAASSQTAAEYVRGSCKADGWGCLAAVKEFPSWVQKANTGDYQAQRNLSYCLVTGCDGAIKMNRPLGCAWRLVIIASGDPKVDSSDTFNFDALCRGKLSESEALQMIGQAERIFLSVYKRAMPR